MTLPPEPFCWVGEPHYPEENPMNPLNDALPARVRQVLYAVLFVAALAFAAYQASEGDWLLFASSLVTSLLGALAASNTSVG